MSNVRNLLSSTVTSRLFTHIMSTEKMRKDTRYRKDRRGTNILTITAVFLKLLLIKSRMRTFSLLRICLLYL